MISRKEAAKGFALIGMPGSGKTTLGRLAAQRLAYGFADLDEWIARDANMAIPEIFRREGEPGFRERETAALTALAALTAPDAAPAGCGSPKRVISTGGGIVAKRANLDLLHALGPIIYIKRDIGDIAASVDFAAGRPLLADREALAALFEARKNLYETWADTVFVNDGSEEDAAARLAETIAAWN
ncbi:MAG: shikimate kinase [Clostridiales Family XIII bacterium]|nr:shikimate kinase [Clostridiales Family XIII bacterium]